MITPPLQVPDEPEHVAYVKQLAETSSLPSLTGKFSASEEAALVDLRLEYVAEDPAHQTISSQAQQQKLVRDLETAERASKPGSEYAGVAASEPPLYYGVESIPYTLGKVGNLLDSIELMRLLSALLGGVTALFTFLFVREVLPRDPWAWTVGGLGVALVPLLGFMSGAVNPDAMLYAVTAALFYGLARAFRHGLTRSHAIWLGIGIAVGFATKLNFVGVAPGALLGLILLSVRSARTLGRAAYISLAIALTVALSPVAVYLLARLSSGASPLAILSGVTHAHDGLWSDIAYIWQLYLPRLPGMPYDFRGISSAQIWFQGYIGLFGWLDTTFPTWVYEFALVPTALIACLCIRAVLSSLAALRGRTVELLVYAVICIGLLTVIGADSYVVFPHRTAEFAQARYLLPLIPLLGVVLALAARGAGRRWGPAVGAGIVMLFLAHDIFSQLQVIARFYG